MYMSERILPAIIAVGWMYLFLAIPCLLVGGLSARFDLFSFSKLRRWRFWSVGTASLLLGLTLGLCAGSFGTRVDHRREHGTRRWWDFTAFSALPGYVITGLCYEVDDEDEAWDYRRQISIWNGVFWAGAVVGAGSLFYFSTPRATSRATLRG
jgi:hypothetical protein